MHMGRVLTLASIFTSFLLSPQFVQAQTASAEVMEYTNSTLQIITWIASIAAVFFIIKGGYEYMTSAGNPVALEAGKKTIRTALIGLLLVLSARVVISVYQTALTAPTDPGSGVVVDIPALSSTTPSDGLTQVLIDAVSAFMQNIVESALTPIVDGITTYLTTTPSVMSNQVIRQFWLISVGIVNALFILIIALVGLQTMSASSLGFEEVELKQILPRIGIAFLGANISLFLADYVILTANTLVTAVLSATGGLNHAWVVNAINPVSLISGSTPLITLIFLSLFLIVAIVLLLMYISRLIMISLGAVLAPFVFLFWALPKYADMASMAVKTYVVTVFIVFVHVVIIQLASGFLTLPEHSENSLVSIAVACGLFFTLIKTPSLMMQMVTYTSRTGTIKKLGNQIMNVMSTDNSSSATRQTAGAKVAKVPRKVVSA